MKKRFLVMAIAGVALAGCVSEDVSDVKQKDEKVKIAFEKPVMYDNAESRAITGELEGKYPSTESFIIFATQYNAADGYNGWVIDGEGEVGFNGHTISFDPILDAWAPKNGDEYYYWEQGKEMAFAACSPADILNSKATYGGTGLKITDYEVSDDADAQYDILFSQRLYDQDSENLDYTSESNYSGIQLTFQHALSSIHFSLFNQTTTKVVLKSIVLTGVNNEGTFNENIEEKNGENYNEIYDRDVNVNPEWTLTGTSTSYTAYSTSFGETIATDEPLYFPETPRHIAEYIADLQEVEGNQSNTYGTSVPLLMLPQPLTDVEAEIKYYIETEEDEEGNPVKKYELKTKSLSLNNLKDTSSNTIAEWEMGHRYVYRLYYSPGSEIADQKIFFGPNLENWADTEVIVVEIK